MGLFHEGGARDGLHSCTPNSAIAHSKIIIYTLSTFTNMAIKQWFQKVVSFWFGQQADSQFGLSVKCSPKPHV